MNETTPVLLMSTCISDSSQQTALPSEHKESMILLVFLDLERSVL